VSNPATDTLTVPAGGFAIGYGFATDASAHRTATWTGISEDFDALIETLGFSHTGAHGTSGSISCEFSVTPSNGDGVVFASFGP
jgi:hypothetical protein